MRKKNNGRRKIGQSVAWPQPGISIMNDIFGDFWDACLQCMRKILSDLDGQMMVFDRRRVDFESESQANDI